MGSYLIRNVIVWDGIEDAASPGEVLVEGNYITGFARGSEHIDTGRAKEVIDGKGQFLMPGMVEGHCHLSFVGPARNQDLGEIPPEEHWLRPTPKQWLTVNQNLEPDLPAGQI